LAIGLLAGCKLLGDKTDLGFITPPKYDSTSVLFVPIQPFFTGFSRPTDICMGYDQLIYVADQGAGLVVQLDESGRRLATRAVPGCHRVVQDRRLDLLVLGTFDTTIQGTPYSLPAIYRLKLVQGTSLNLATAEMRRVATHPFYFKVSFSNSDGEPRLNDLDLLADDSYYVTRSGPGNNPNKFGGPDNSVLIFNRNDQWQGTVVLTTDQGQITNYFNEPHGITTLAKPPQNSVNTSRDFIVGQLGPNTALRTQWINVGNSPSGDISYTLNTGLVLGDTSQAQGFLYSAFRFTQPVGLGYAGDGTNYLFVADAARDSLYLFTSTGLEGVRPPAGSASTKNIRVSFGGTGEGPTQFRAPVAVGHLNKTLYVVDRDNGRISRFRLTTDFR
jgi:hypothetical protein